MDRNYALKEYDVFLSSIFDTEDISYKDFSDEDYDGCIGVAMVLAFIDGCEASIPSLAKSLGVSPHEQRVNDVYHRLKVNGILGQKYSAWKDKSLAGKSQGNPWISGFDWGIRCWCIIAGVASGYTGVRNI